MHQMGFGFDCSSIAELDLARNTGAHGHAMGFNYYGQLRPKELLLRKDGTVELIRGAQSLDDYLATLSFTPDMYQPSQATRAAQDFAN